MIKPKKPNFTKGMLIGQQTDKGYFITNGSYLINREFARKLPPELLMYCNQYENWQLTDGLSGMADTHIPYAGTFLAQLVPPNEGTEIELTNTVIFNNYGEPSNRVFKCDQDFTFLSEHYLQHLTYVFNLQAEHIRFIQNGYLRPVLMFDKADQFLGLLMPVEIKCRPSFLTVVAEVA